MFRNQQETSKKGVNKREGLLSKVLTFGLNGLLIYHTSLGALNLFVGYGIEQHPNHKELGKENPREYYSEGLLNFGLAFLVNHISKKRSEYLKKDD
jgi:hypothetical protein